ncbi:hypothetical protein M9H77_22196 [Catharanthus roseus]|uniref:Uncharacterized protein n=1 Tax=Catharanthus roseus TaxID=4058 RepID=A0ACC0ATU5_CATRO|nr:hypothetical protein M9H77_22196 [Catharanthus roseus]
MLNVCTLVLAISWANILLGEAVKGKAKRNILRTYGYLDPIVSNLKVADILLKRPRQWNSSMLHQDIPACKVPSKDEYVFDIILRGEFTISSPYIFALEEEERSRMRSSPSTWAEVKKKFLEVWSLNVQPTQNQIKHIEMVITGNPKMLTLLLQRIGKLQLV